MGVGAQQEAAPFGNGQAIANEHDLVEQLHMRLNLVWRYGECLAEALGEPMVQSLWRSIRSEELATIGRLRRHIADCMDQGVFQQGL
ncbi:MAG TPA: hypothetical protein VNZ22_08035 [Bacillota bacterium]|nr:hypothetical protein [Bacillota bacterium]